MTQSGMLFLNKQRKKSHYDAANTLKWTAFIPIVLFFVFIFKYSTEKLGTIVIVCTVMTSVFLLVSYFTFKSQQEKLKLTSFLTDVSKGENYTLTKKTLEALQWIIKEDTYDFIEAYNPHRDMRTWGNEMISIVLLDGHILLNSICNLDAMNQSGFSFGKNKQNIDKFIETFELITYNQVQQSV
ncbi:MAG: hypothetical protein ACTHMD_11695 [Flavisolibacter sp.]